MDFARIKIHNDAMKSTSLSRALIYAYDKNVFLRETRRINYQLSLDDTFFKWEILGYYGSDNHRGDQLSVSASCPGIS